MLSRFSNDTLIKPNPDVPRLNRKLWLHQRGGHAGFGFINCLNRNAYLA